MATRFPKKWKITKKNGTILFYGQRIRAKVKKKKICKRNKCRALIIMLKNLLFPGPIKMIGGITPEYYDIHTAKTVYTMKIYCGYFFKIVFILFPGRLNDDSGCNKRTSR